MLTSSAKAKGARLCKEVKQIILQHFPFLEDGDINVRSSGANGEDLMLSPKALMSLPLAIECKNCERLNIWAAYEQAEANTKIDQVPVVVFSRNRRDPLVCLDLEHFLELIRKRNAGDIADETF